jgi:hypothetical protein
MLKIGRLAIRNGDINWKSFKENVIEGRAKDAFSTRFSQTTDISKAMVGSIQRKHLSVVTPSVAKTRAPSMTSSSRDYNFHISNPNP